MSQQINPLPSPPSPAQTHTPSQTAAPDAPDAPETPAPSLRNNMPAAECFTFCPN